MNERRSDISNGTVRKSVVTWTVLTHIVAASMVTGSIVLWVSDALHDIELQLVQLSTDYVGFKQAGDRYPLDRGERVEDRVTILEEVILQDLREDVRKLRERLDDRGVGGP